MRRRLIETMAVCLLACAASAGPVARTFKVTMGALANGTNTLAEVRGYIDEVHVSVSDGASTGTVALTYAPLDGVTAAISVATGATTGSKVWRPRVDGTAVAGTALTSDPPSRFMLAGETLSMTVTGSPTNVAWTATIKLDQ